MVIAEATRRLLGACFELEDLGAHELKGIGEPVRAWRVARRAARSRAASRRCRRAALLPLVGRDQELALLLERWAQAKAGEGQGVLLAGEPGSASRGSAARCSSGWPTSRTRASATSARPTTPTARSGR